MTVGSAYPFFTGRLGPFTTLRAKEHCTMSIVFLNGGGLAKDQMDQVPLAGSRFGISMRRVLHVISFGLLVPSGSRRRDRENVIF